MTSTPQPFSDLILERVLLGELPAGELEETRRLILADPDASARLAALARSNAQILARYPTSDMAGRIQVRARTAQTQGEIPRAKRQGSPRSLFFALPALAGAAVLVLTVVEREIPVTAPVELSVESTRTKGAMQLIMVRKRGTQAERLTRADARARAGDLLQIAYRAGGGFGVIVSVDGRGNVTQHLPERGDLAAVLDSRGPVMLASAYELDDAPNFETFFFVYGRETFATSTVIEAAKGMARTSEAAASGDEARLSLPQGLEQTTFVVHKTEL